MTNNPNNLPTVQEYADYLQQACNKYSISIDEARERYGLFTVGQWEELLNRKTLFLEKRGMELRDKEAEFSDLQSYRLTADGYNLLTWDGKQIFAEFSLWKPCKEQREYIGMGKDDPEYIIRGIFGYIAEDRLCYRWMTKKERINPRVIARGEFYPFTKDGLLAYVNECIAAEPYDEIIIKD